MTYEKYKHSSLYMLCVMFQWCIVLRWYISHVSFWICELDNSSKNTNTQICIMIQNICRALLIFLSSTYPLLFHSLDNSNRSIHHINMICVYKHWKIKHKMLASTGCARNTLTFHFASFTVTLVFWNIDTPNKHIAIYVLFYIGVRVVNSVYYKWKTSRRFQNIQIILNAIRKRADVLLTPTGCADICTFFSTPMYIVTYTL